MQNSLTEIERKFLIDAFPTDLPLKRQHQVYQAYLSLNPKIRIRRNVKGGEDIAYFLTIKSAMDWSERRWNLIFPKLTFMLWPR